MFNLFDADGGGTVDTEEFMEMLDVVHMKMSEEEVSAMIRSVAGDDVEELDFALFVELIASARTTGGGGGVLGKISELREGFTMFDTDGSGALDAGEIQEVLASLGSEMELAEVEKIINKIDEDGDGELNFFEFISLVATQESQEAVTQPQRSTVRPEEHLRELLSTPPEPSKTGEILDPRYTRHNEETSAAVLAVMREELKCEFFKDIADTVGLSLCSQMKLAHVKPTDPSVAISKRRVTYRQYKPMSEFNVLISGQVYVFQSDPEKCYGTEITKYQLDRFRTNSLWCQVGPVMQNLCHLFHTSLVQMPVEDDAYSFTEATKEMLHDLAYMHRELYSWYTLGRKDMRSDVDSVLSSESLMSQVT